MELVMGVGPMNLVITNDALYQLSYTSAATRIITKTIGRGGRETSRPPLRLNTLWRRPWR